MTRVLFKDRASAGHMLAREAVSRHFERPVVYALPRGGVPVAVPVAAALDAPLDLLLVRKIGVQRQPELAAASIVDGERRDIIINERVARAAGLSKADLDLLAKDQWSEIERRRTMYMRNRSAIPANGRTAILVDDGVATGASMLAAVAAIRRRNPLATVVAIPVASRDAIEHLAMEVDEVIALATPADFTAVGNYYADFHQLEDAEVISLLGDAPPADLAPYAPSSSRRPR
jgi:putative phosphoribosyl transferase